LRAGYGAAATINIFQFISTHIPNKTIKSRLNRLESIYHAIHPNALGSDQSIQTNVAANVNEYVTFLKISLHE